MTGKTAYHHERPDLARGYADALMGQSAFGLTSGLFLAAPRRTGKSTFLRADLAPALEARGVLVLYVDLWSDRERDPAELIAGVITDAMMADRSLWDKLTEGLGLYAVRVGPFTVRIGQEGPPKGRDVTLSEALVALAEARGTPVALMVDEAQHAISTDAGRDAMFALKSARDAMNVAGRAPRLALVFTGSHRDKLMALVDGRGQPFYGATVLDLPVLGDDYVAGYAARINAGLAAGKQFDRADLTRAFALVGHRPELLEQVVAEHALGGIGPENLGVTVSERAETLRARLWAQYASDHGQLTALQRAVLAQIVVDGDQFAPFSEPTLEAVAERLGDKMGTSRMQSALDALRDKGLIWRGGRGRYALEDQGIADWLAAMVDA